MKKNIITGLAAVVLCGSAFSADNAQALFNKYGNHARNSQFQRLLKQVNLTRQIIAENNGKLISNGDVILKIGATCPASVAYKVTEVRPNEYQESVTCGMDIP